MTFSIMTLSIMTFSIMTFSIMTFIIMTLSINGFLRHLAYKTLGISDTQHNNTLPFCRVLLCSVVVYLYSHVESLYAECRFTECCGTLVRIHKDFLNVFFKKFLKLSDMSLERFFLDFIPHKNVLIILIIQKSKFTQR
jgi:hypothetical protein